MRIITTTRIKQAMLMYPQWRVGLTLWQQTFNRTGLKFESFAQIKALWRIQSGWNVDRVPARKVGETAFNGNNYDLYIFDVHKNDCRILARIDSTRSKIFIREILSHADYDKWIKSHIK
ncbi:type II toxin-antitoxin system HigB family toxin [Photobacterium toruni]|uniref:Type II toxin-antitoxin system HigB family toxin n=1 Tax=Photobacterium toruni TaxID=1935446 RepID=A0ABU6L535_9GAMM|nr:type II toxin-antitoxin system HigB family toxin [Photobacterium toruni]